MKRLRAWVGLVMLAFGVAAFVAASARWQGLFDLRVYHGAVRSWLHGGDLYAYRQPAPTRAFGFTYPPFAALVMVPLAAAALPVAAVLLAVASLSGTVALLWRRLHRPLPVLAGVVLLFATEPWRDTLSLGQINLVLLAMVGVDLLFLLDRRPAAGVLIGIAAGIKLVPALFVVYLVLTRRYRAALVAGGTALVTVCLGWLVAPGASRAYWTDLLWQTDRVGDIVVVGNQSMSGALHRLHLTAAWPALVAVVLAVWAFRVRKAGALPDHWAGLALTGVAMCLVSPISWVHHLVWQLPAVLILLDSGATGWRRHWFRLLAVGVYAMMATKVVWLFEDPDTVGYQVGSNIHAITGLVLLTAVPIRPARPGSGPERRYRRRLRIARDPYRGDREGSDHVRTADRLGSTGSDRGAHRPPRQQRASTHPE
ncbi:glycosyltransferase 87 family protein [Dactylosporangium sucinum]|uniref:Integral membrane protein n=1 Tax=Dactylosporangium sucinum TaxID=1424081 RepID=A0A917SZG1_9ACTN|nr:glycosyltransferase 87 family protein [Dactylosporangium sucinum]GGM04854.1 hypothetical protein GCM10007977_002530 [Dactylosporangium sucinum]